MLGGMSVRMVSLSAVVLVLVACKAPPKTDDRPDASVPTASAFLGDAGAANFDGGTVNRDAGMSAGAPIDLLHYGAARVNVSSNVDNPRDLPEHLVDGNEATAWNGRTGDLVGARISFAFPKTAKITSLSLSAGWNKVNARGEDLFLMNHRIKKVTILRLEVEGTTGVVLESTVGEWRLDPTRREPQVLPLALPGGTYVVRVDEVEPGTRKEWRELVVSELRVMGIPAGAPFRHRAIPDVTVGHDISPLSDPLAEAVRFPLPYGQLFADETLLCKRFDEAIAPKHTPPNDYSPEKPWCLVGPRLHSGAADAGSPSLEIRKIDISDENGSAQALALHTAAGWAVPEGSVFSNMPCPRGCMDDMVQVRVEVLAVTVSAGLCTIDVKEVSTGSDGPPPPTVTTEWYTLRCRLDEPALRCSHTTTKVACTPEGPACP